LEIDRIQLLFPEKSPERADELWKGLENNKYGAAAKEIYLEYKYKDLYMPHI